MLDVVVARLAPVVDDILIVGPRREDLDPSVTWVDDSFPGEGPLGGLITGLRRMTSLLGVAVGCDMPLLSPRLVKSLVDTWDSESQAVVPRLLGRPQPLHAVYSPDALGPLESAFVAGGRSIQRALRDLSVQWVEIEGSRDAESFTSVNTPAEWERLSGTAAVRESLGGG